MPRNQEEEFVSLIKQHEKIIHKVIALHIDGPEERKDLYQEILLQTWKSFNQFSGKSKFSTWLYRISTNTVFTHKRNEHKKTKTISNSTIERNSSPVNDEIHEQLYYLIRKLSPVDRTVMTSHLDGYKNTEIAEILGITVNHVNVKIHRLKNQLIAQLKKVHHGSI